MANILNIDTQIAIIGGLTEGQSIRSLERMTGVHRDTIMRLGVRIGQGCTRMMDTTMRDLPCQRLEVDEIWGFVGKKERNVKVGEESQVGNIWTWCAIDADTKLMPSFKCGERNLATAKMFLQDLSSRMANRVQLTSDGFHGYAKAVEASFGKNVDYGQIVKIYGTMAFGERKYSSGSGVLSSYKNAITGNPDWDLISTSYIERLNATTRTHMRRLTRLTLAFSKKRENFEAAVGLHFAFYNFVKRHSTLRTTPAVAAGVTGKQWSIGELVEVAG
jgi:IS1 family transposase